MTTETNTIITMAINLTTVTDWNKKDNFVLRMND